MWTALSLATFPTLRSLTAAHASINTAFQISMIVHVSVTAPPSMHRSPRVGACDRDAAMAGRNRSENPILPREPSLRQCDGPCCCRWPPRAQLCMLAVTGRGTPVWTQVSGWDGGGEEPPLRASNLAVLSLQAALWLIPPPPSLILCAAPTWLDRGSPPQLCQCRRRRTRPLRGSGAWRDRTADRQGGVVRLHPPCPPSPPSPSPRLLPPL